MRANTGNFILYGIFFTFLILNISFWLLTNHLRPVWGNVPPVPTQRGAIMMALGDQQLSYRMVGLMLQNLGNTGGDSRNLKEYDYQRLGDWLFLADNLDPISNFIPSLSAFYFGATTKGDDLGPVVDYLEMAGQRPQKHKWRWLAQAIYLARYQQGDYERALELAHKLAALPRDDMPPWTRQMPAFVMTAKGDKEAAYALMMGILKNGIDDMTPVEIRFIRDYVCDRILTPEQAAQNDLCTKTR
ncbi:MAG: hypothetical protein ACXW30_02720 [Micavibrio sp.]